MLTRAEMTKVLVQRGLMVAALVGLSSLGSGGQSNNSKTSAGPKTASAGSADDASKANNSEVAKTLKAAAEAVGLARWSGVGGQHLPEVDVINTMEVWGSGTTYGPGQSNKPGEPWQAYKTEYHAAIGYNPPAMRVEMTRTPGTGDTTPLHTIKVVRDTYAWDESEIGAGLIPGKGIATPALASASSRLLLLWILPYGVIKAAVAAGESTKISTENGSTVVTFPLSGQLAGVQIKATLDSDHEVIKVETRCDNPALTELVTETEYSDYADHGEILTDVKSPGHIVRKQGGRPIMDIHVKMLDANNPYLVFPVPENVTKAAAH